MNLPLLALVLAMTGHLVPTEFLGSTICSLPQTCLDLIQSPCENNGGTSRARESRLGPGVIYALPVAVSKQDPPG